MKIDWDKEIAAARSGDWKAEDLVFKSSVAVCRGFYFSKKSDWKITEDDAMSVANLAIAKAMSRYVPIGKSYKAYLEKIFQNAIYDSCLRNRGDALGKGLWLVPIDDNSNENGIPPTEIVDTNSNPELETEAAETSRRLYAALKLLSKNERAAFLLHHQGLDNSEIGEVLPGMNVVNLIYHAKQKLIALV